MTTDGKVHTDLGQQVQPRSRLTTSQVMQVNFPPQSEVLFPAAAPEESGSTGDRIPPHYLSATKYENIDEQYRQYGQEQYNEQYEHDGPSSVKYGHRVTSSPEPDVKKKQVMLPRQHTTEVKEEDKDTSIENLARNQDNLTRLLVEQHKQASLPKRTLQTFTGDPLQYVTFIRAFQFIIENKSKSNRDRLYYLEQYTRGEANSLVKSCIHMDDEVGYLEAKRLLERKYEKQARIATNAAYGRSVTEKEDSTKKEERVKNPNYQTYKARRNLATNTEAVSASVTSNSPGARPNAYTQDKIPGDFADIINQDDIDAIPYMEEVKLGRKNDESQSNIGLLIGNNVPKAFEPIHVVNSQGEGPFACQTRLGWTVYGVKNKEHKRTSVIHRIKAHDTIDQQLEKLCNAEFNERIIDDKPERSVSEGQFLNRVEASIKYVDGHYQVGFPLKDDDMKLPNNIHQAEQRACHLKRKLERDSVFNDQYTAFMNDMFKNDYAEEVPKDACNRKDGKVWYVPHHGVFHPTKGKLRVVFDCAAKYMGQSLNSQLLKGPDLTSNLVGVLTRFREHPVGVVADIKAMYHQVRVPEPDRDLDECALVRRNSSPSCANLALRKTADDGKEKYSEEVCNTVLSNFYVDDYLKSIESESKAIQLVSDLTSLCKDGGFKLTKWLSNSREVLQSVPEDDRAETTKTLDLKNEELPSEKVLGLLWSPQTHRLGLHIKVKERPPTRRGILATVSSIYDPLGFVAPAILPAKQILQNLSKLQLGWDESIPSELLTRWERWLDEVPKLSDFTIERCFKPKDFEESEVQMHHFCDASQKGYGSVSYLRFVNESGQVHLTLLTAKARVAPLKIITIPRLELTAAAMAVKVNNMLQKELQLKVESTYFWTDSQTVIKYINNDTARFHTFVANRVALIRDGSQPHQWKYVGTSSNPADDCSRGLAVDCFLKNRRWTDGPDFLHKAENQWPKTTIGNSAEELADDPEVKKKLVVNTASTEEATDTMEKLLTRFSSWYQLCHCVAWILRVKKYLRKICHDRDDDKVDDRVDNGDDDGRKNDENEEHGNITDLLNVADMQEAERAVIVYVQTKAYPEEIKTLKELQLRSNDSQPEDKLRKVSKIKKASPLYRLNPFIEDGVIRVGGRLAKSALPEKTKFPSIIPKKSHIAKLILHDVHEATGHGGRNHMLAHLHKKYWITNANAAARKVINSCITCRKRNAKVQQQMMSDLPKDRVTPGEPPFSRVGMDYFGPLEVKQGRSIVKRYGVVFVCLASKAIHIEMAAPLDTDACVNVILTIRVQKRPSETDPL
ncbi:uncharacterized protein [Amphiura filiformis]|uniref:uncharacterized protein n=1 Tax=Amphiura filiformis TaxID=82378 RepID=UPI003B228374